MTEKTRRLRWRACALILSVALALLVGEVAVRVHLTRRPPRLRPDDHAGWRTVESYCSSGPVTDAAGRTRNMTYTTNADGFRTFGTIASTKPRILVLGDSFTQAADVSDEECYHALLRDKLDAEVFAYGAGGYGSLQELMILDEWFERIHPDLVVWQFCANDLVNNDEALERASRLDNNGMRRPYLALDGSIAYALPKPFPALRALGDASKLAFALFHCWDRMGTQWGHTVEEEIAQEGARHAGFAHAAAVTEKIMGRVKRRCGETPIFAFSADDREPYYLTLESICRRAGITFMAGIPENERAALHRGTGTRAADRGHWNDVGHRLCAEEIARHLAGTKVRRDHALVLPLRDR